MSEARWRIGWHEIGDVTDDEKFAGLGVENDLGRDAQVAAANDHNLGLLPAFGELFVTASLERQPRLGKRTIAVD